MSEMLCPCGTGQPYSACCGVFHAGAAAATAEQLMRSRYSAYALKRLDYLYATHHPKKRPASAEDLRPWAERATFIRLEVRAVQLGAPTDAIGKVEFRAHFREAGQNHVMHEISRFRRWKGRWVYYDGQPPV